MIITKLKGGLGNQLFQYACGKSLSQKNNDKLKLDTTGYGENNGIDTMRHYSLYPFNIVSSIASRDEIRSVKYPYGIISKGIRLIKARVLRINNIKYKEIRLKPNSDYFLDGFFQSEKYFKDIEGVIRKEFTLRNPMGNDARIAEEEIKKAKIAISLHIRRGDYVSDKKTNDYHGTCDMEYYRKALETIYVKLNRPNISDIVVFIFSDDIEWAKANLALEYKMIFVSKPSIPDYEELTLMSKCHHNIIANSSFSWWGAWLNAKSDKIVIAPRQWTKKDEKNYRDIVPSTWIRI